MRFLQAQIPKEGLFANKEWRFSPKPFGLSYEQVVQLEELGRMLLQFYRAANMLYRYSVEGKMPSWIAEYLEQGKSSEIIEIQRSAVFKKDLPRVIRPDVLITEQGLSVVELDNVPGGIGLTAWLNQKYSELGDAVLGGKEGMLQGFAAIFGKAAQVHVLVSEESQTYRPEMEWLLSQYPEGRFHLKTQDNAAVSSGDAVYRFFELFDSKNIPVFSSLVEKAKDKQITITPPLKSQLEEKMLLALFWNRNLKTFWRKELSEKVYIKLQKLFPYTWLVDPRPLPPHAAIPELNIPHWQELKELSQKERELILKVSGYSALAWGSRGVYLGSDLSREEWCAVVDRAIADFPQSPYVLQRFHKPQSTEVSWVDLSTQVEQSMQGRVRLCPYYFVSGEDEKMKTEMGGVLASICPADKKLIHGMTDAIMTCCCEKSDS